MGHIAPDVTEHRVRIVAINARDQPATAALVEAT
jgi:hypothetical protein